MNIKYNIEFFTDWHCGSGLAAGADVDALVVKDNDGLPFVPGKTVKGLVREAVEEIRQLQKKSIDDLHQAFGFFDSNKGTIGKDSKEKGSMFFTNAELSQEEHDAIVANGAARFMYRTIASTAIESDGIAKQHSLRKIQTVVPCKVYGRILNVPNSLDDEIIMTTKFIKRLGQNRNRGFGRCIISAEKEVQQ